MLIEEVTGMTCMEEASGRIGRGAWSSRTNFILVQEQERFVDQSWKITFPRLKRRAFVGFAVCTKLDQSARLIR